MKKALLFVALVCAAGLAILYPIWTQGYSWSEMDWDSDGTTSISELFDSGGIGKRPVTRDGAACTEYFRYKDGLPVRVVC